MSKFPQQTRPRVVADHQRYCFQRDNAKIERVSRLCHEYDVRPSVRRSVRPCVTLANCDHTVQTAAKFLIPHKRAITLVFWHQQWLAGDASFRLKFALKELFVNLRPCNAYALGLLNDTWRSIYSSGWVFWASSEIGVFVLLHSCT